ncbi:MAG: Peptide deformylase [Candidatus Beckwithbacteria bacterium GW2011_GWC2_47_9]|uniref:Peptide deformylase n=3 Tax=Candidatus Beckwithiibacteriota TaxID=1752726 RepID=A0A0G1U158_9BACT|nr:MAG: Peptide deformylase [Candidatus Beckwithbacteria bacterium GW2011_GWC2_47_9]OGD56197.1 MAG: peptide deformylase [Candidatus Beckwithbacteria bacterium RIFCSPHIGHO2_12_FULL_47_17]OGD58218.1 MAG: peptide deformylase [Candidatus Beckwithbacteria bacterium RIFCSPLOWO2_02_FULL_47_23]
MAKILTYPHPALRQKAEAVTKFDQTLVKLVTTLKDSLIPNPHEPVGVGLAANQIGVLKRVFLMTLPNKKIEAIVNPEIVKIYPKTMAQLPEDQQFMEGCLSFLGYYGFVDRPIKIKVRYQTVGGKTREQILLKPFSSYFQHERDHLDGILFIDYLKISGEPIYLADKKSGKLKKVTISFL